MHNKILLNNFGVFNSQQWAIVPKQDVLTLVNNYTIDQFIYQKVNSNSWHLLEIYKSRAQYTIPNTPQIILANHQPDNFNIEMFVQYAPFQLDRLIKKNACETTIQELIKNVLRIIQFLVKKFGFFRITKDMIKVTRSCNILVWMHDKFSSTHRQYPLSSSNIYEDYKIMIKDLLTIFEAAGCKKQLQNLKIKIQSDKLLSFQKFKIVLENKLKCQNKSNQKSAKIYRSPQFLKTKNSPDSSKRAATQNFFLTVNPAKKQTRFATSLNLGTNFSNNSNCSGTNQKILNFDDTQPQRRLLSNKTSSKSIHLNYSEANLNKFQKSQPKQGSLNCKINIQETTSDAGMKKKNFRDSGNSLSTAAFMNQISSSGKLKLTSFDEHNFCSTPKGNQNKALASSVGNKQTKKIKQLKQTFKVKESKIIQQKNQEAGLNPLQSFIKGQKQIQSARESDLQKDFDCLLKSETSSNYRPSSSLVELESQIFNILFN